MKVKSSILVGVATLGLTLTAVQPAQAVTYNLSNGGASVIRYCTDRLTTSSSTATCPSGNKTLAAGATAAVGSFYFGSGYAWCYHSSWLSGPRWYNPDRSQTIVPERWPLTRTVTCNPDNSITVPPTSTTLINANFNSDTVGTSVTPSQFNSQVGASNIDTGAYQSMTYASDGSGGARVRTLLAANKYIDSGAPGNGNVLRWRCQERGIRRVAPPRWLLVGTMIR